MRWKLFLVLLVCMTLLMGSKTPTGEIQNATDIEMLFAYAGDSIFAGKFETSNILYRQFMNELRMKRRTDDLKMVRPNPKLWQKYFDKSSTFEKYYHTHTAFDNYPVVNIPYEAAVLYCQWLTEKYNAFEHKEFKKVKFRLPTKEEWEKAAHGGIEKIPYPFGYFLVNPNGQTFCNYKRVGDEAVHTDKLSNNIVVVRDIVKKRKEFIKPNVTVPIDAFFANGFGLFNMSGNVAEMTIKKGETKGGGWNDTGYDVRIKSTGTYNGPSPDIGFRVFMEVEMVD